MTASRTQLVGQIQVPGQKPQNVTIIESARTNNSGTVFIDDFEGGDLGQRLSRAAATISTNGGLIDATRISGTQTITEDPFDGITAPLHIIFGPYTVEMTISTLIMRPGSNHTIEMRGTTFQPDADGDDPATGNIGYFTTKIFDTTGTCSAAASTITVASATGAEIGALVATVGAGPASSNQTTTLNGAINDSVTTITLTDGTGFVPGNNGLGVVLIESELITYTAVSGNDLTGCTRGVYGTSAASHIDTTQVDAVVKRLARIVSISGTTLTLDNSFTRAVTDAPVEIGSVNTRFIGSGDFNGRQDRVAADPNNNVSGIEGKLATKLFVDSGITFHHWDFSGVFLRACWDCVINAQRYYSNSRPADAAGGDIWIFGNSRYNSVHASHMQDGYAAIVIDDRSSSLDSGYIGRPEDNDIYVGNITEEEFGFIIGGLRNSILCGSCDSTTTAVDINGSANQWLVDPQPIQNTVRILGRASGSTNWVTIQAAAVDGGNVVIAGIAKGSISTQSGNVVEYYFDAVGGAQDYGLMQLGVATYTPTNVTTDRTYDANSTTTAELADVLGTLIADLQTSRVID